MRRVLLIGSLLIVLYACKKDSDTASSSGSFITLNNDTRQLGIIPSASITITNAAFNSPDEWQLSVGIKSACYKIAGLNNDEFEVYVDIWDKKLLKSEYTIVPYTKTSGTASLGIRPYKIGGSGLTWFDGLSGKIRITKNSAGKLASVEFTQIPLTTFNSQSYTVSARIIVAN